MTMTTKLDTLKTTLQQALGDRVSVMTVARGEITIEVSSEAYREVMPQLRDDAGLAFEELMDLCGVDYSEYADGEWRGKRFAVVVHLLSLTHNWRVRVRCFAEEDQQPTIASVVDVWPSANWFEREAFDLFGIVFDGHPDLRRILTDYGFEGHPFRKDFPVSGYVEMKYDPEQKKVVYQPVTIEARELTPRVRREEGYGRRDG